MSKARKARPRARSPLTRLIAAGQAVHRALLAPARERGLEAGDDVLLYLLATEANVTSADLAAATGMSPEALRRRLSSLIGRELVVLKASGANLTPRLVLTPRGVRLEALLAEHWATTEETLLGDLTPKQRKTLGQRLKTIAAKLGD
jgi:DNA-binding MarR family transcriptional regulator